MDFLFFSDKLLTFKNEDIVIEKDFYLGVREGEIVYLGKDKPKEKAKKEFHFKNHLLAPGFVNTHTHLPMSVFRALADNLNLMTWLENYIFPLEASLLNKKSIKTGVKLSLAEMIRSGITSVYDMYFYNKEITDCLIEAGVRGIVGVGHPSVEKDQDWKKKTLDLRSEYKDHPLVKMALAPHAPYTVEKEILKEMGECSKKENLPLVIHVGESEWEQEEIKKKYGKTPIEYLHSLNLTDKNSLFVHCVYASEKELDIMAKTETSFSYNPKSNMKLGNGVAPVSEALKRGVRVGLGTDGAASNNSLNFFDEMGTGARLQAVRYQDESLTASSMYHMATKGGALASNLNTGSLEVGKKADIIAIDLKNPSFYPSYNLVSSLVYSASGSHVSFVMCEGKVLMEDYKLKTLNEDEIFREAEEFALEAKDFLKNK